MKKLVVTLNIGNYLPELTALTFPMMQTWATKIGAEFRVLTERKFPDVPIINYEKFQLHAIIPDYDWVYFLDSDALVVPDTPDWAEMVNDKSQVIFHGIDNRLARFKASNYSRRSGSLVGACTWNVICSNWCADLWQPPEDWRAACQNISLLWCEAKTGQCPRDHLIDDYQLSENIARYGLKIKTIQQISRETGHEAEYYRHLYNCDPYEKLRQIRAKLDEMGIRS
jgi:hypothetical protein